MLNILDSIIEEKWDARRWEIALRSDKPVDTYQQIVADVNALKDSTNIEDMSQEEKDWLRNSG